MTHFNFYISFFLGLTLFTGSSEPIHEYYVSSTEMVYVSKKKQIQLTTRIFIDDIEAFFNAESNTQILLYPDNEGEKIDRLVQDFFEHNFDLYFDKKEVDVRYLGRQYKEDQILIFAEANNVLPPSRFEIHNTILTTFREGQQNIIHVKTPTAKKSFLMDASKTILAQHWIQ